MSLNSAVNEEENLVDVGLVRPQNISDKVGDPIDNMMTDNLNMKELSISKD